MIAMKMAILCLARNDASTVSLCLFRALLLFPFKKFTFPVLSKKFSTYIFLGTK